MPHHGRHAETQMGCDSIEEPTNCCLVSAHSGTVLIMKFRSLQSITTPHFIQCSRLTPFICLSSGDRDQRGNFVVIGKYFLKSKHMGKMNPPVLSYNVGETMKANKINCNYHL